MRSITRDARGKFVPVVRPKSWKASSIVRSRERSDRIAIARMEQKKRMATTQLLRELNPCAIAELEAAGIPWAAVQRWLDEVHPSEAFMSRRFLKQILLVLSDEQAAPRERFEARRDLYQRLIAAGIVD